MTNTPNIHSVEDARIIARRRLPWMVFDYIDGAAGSETGAKRDRAALEAFTLEPRILRRIETVSLSKSVFGQRAERPFGISPMGMCNLAHPKADRALARLAAKYNVPLGVSTMSSTPLETLLKWSEGNAWFQLYFSGSGETSFKLAHRAQEAGYKTLVLTVDVPVLGRRPRELRHGFKMPFRIGPRQFIDFALHPRWSIQTLLQGAPKIANAQMESYAFERTERRSLADWDTLKRLRELWKGQLVVKGVLNVEDALTLKAGGVDALQISNHGARQLESSSSPFDRLPLIREAVGPKFPIFFDSGIRSGEDILKCLAQGADFVFLGRALSYGSAADGPRGLNTVWNILSEELRGAMVMTGLSRLD